MRFLVRADAGTETGTGHVMRCLTLAEELATRGHEVSLLASLGTVDWLHDQVRAAGLQHHDTEPASLDADRIAAEGWDAVIVDSYVIDAGAISALNAATPVLAVIDGDHRGIEASLYLDQNLGAELQAHPAIPQGALLAGSRYALVRQAVRALRREDRWQLPRDPTVLAFMGGSDPLGAMVPVTASLCQLAERVNLTLVTAPQWQAEVRTRVGQRAGAQVVAPTSDLPALLSQADIVVSATGTSAWDIGTLGVPAVFAAVVDNQQAGLQSIVDARVGLGIDAAENLARLHSVHELVEQLVDDESLRRELVATALQTFDGQGASRVADALERLR